MKKHNTMKVVLITLLVFMLLTWILPAAYFSGEYVDQGRIQMGFFDLFSYPGTVMSYFGYISLFVLTVGGFYGVLHKIPAYRSFLDKIVAICKGKEGIVLGVIMVLLAAITSVTGTHFALFLFFPMLASIILLMGYDKIVVALTLVGSTMVGVIGTTYGYANVGLLDSVLNLEVGQNVLVKVVVLVAGLVLLIFNTLVYAKDSKVASKAVKAEKKVILSEEVEEEVVVVEDEDEEKEEVVDVKKPAKKSSSKKSTSTKKTTKKTGNTSKKSGKASKKDLKAFAKKEDVIVVKESLLNDSLEEFVPTVVDSKYRVLPIVLSFLFLLVIVVLAFMPWADVFKVTIFDNATKSINTFELFGFTIFEKLLGGYNTFGQWTISDLSIVMAFVALVLSLIYKVKFSEVINGFVEGAKKAVAPAFIILLIYTGLVAVTYHPFQLFLYSKILGKEFSVITASIAAMLASLFNADPAYTFQAVVPYFTSIVADTKVYPIVEIIFQSMYGLTMLVAPTSVVLTAVLSYLNVSFKEWFKAVWKLFLELLVVLLLVFVILLLV